MDDVAKIDRLFVADDTGFTPRNLIKKDSGAATLAKLQHFTVEAKSLDASRMIEMRASEALHLGRCIAQNPSRRQARQPGHSFFLRGMQKIHNKGKQALDEYCTRQQARTDELIAILHDLAVVLQRDDSVESLLDRQFCSRWQRDFEIGKKLHQT